MTAGLVLTINADRGRTLGRATVSRKEEATHMSQTYPELEEKLRHLAEPLPAPRPGDWLAEHTEPGQTFAEYVDSRPVRKGDKLHTIYLCLV